MNQRQYILTVGTKLPTAMVGRQIILPAEELYSALRVQETTSSVMITALQIKLMEWFNNGRGFGLIVKNSFR